MLLLTYDAALRSKELHLCVWTDFDFAARTVRVRRAAKGRDRKEKTKPPRVVTIPLARPTVAALQRLPRHGPHPFACWGPREFQYWFLGLCERIGIARAKSYSHVLRASRATHLHESGADVKAIQRQLGHWSEATTWIYIHMTDERKRAVDRHAAEAAEEVLKGTLSPPDSDA